MATNRVDFIVITALEEELAAALRFLPNPRKENPTDEDTRVYWRCTLPIVMPDGAKTRYELAMMTLPNMGRVEAANATNDAIRFWKPRYVMMIGIAGGIAEEGIALGDILIADQIVDYELQKQLPEGNRFAIASIAPTPDCLTHPRM
ncbi:5'-methylthioadenosine/S-adenosylhomocysteine nucleosidase [Phycisphaerae bacterium RAS1]|nr:5'-methylthioadenosine/S-adenosylhomocysteine nucleosidase [Phycisphaerae bacterium RAS1]